MLKYKVTKELPQFNTTSPVFFDIETEKLYLGTRLVQVYQPDTSNIVYILDTDLISLDTIKEWLKDKWLIGHGLTYDFGTLNMTSAKFDDTLYLSRIAYPEWREYGLDKIIDRIVPEDLYEGLDKKKLQKAGFIKGAYLSQAQLRYSATDVYALQYIWELKKIQIARDNMAYKVDILNMKYAVEYQQNGLIPNREDVRKELDKLEDKIEENYQILNGVNCNSYKQVREALNSNESSKEYLIKVISQQGPKATLAKAVYDQRRLLKRRTMLESYNKPIVYTKFNVAGAITGRFTSTGGDLDNGINAQQIPRDLQYIFNQNTEDTVVVHADYSTAELRAGCSIMRDETMYQQLKDGIDLHKVSASLATGKPLEDITKEDRQKGKAVSFGFIFGMSAASFVEYAYVNYGVIFTEEEAKIIKSKYNSMYTGISAYHKLKWNTYKETPAVTPLGHICMSRLGTDAINHATQGGIAETMKLAVHYLCKDYPEATKYIFNIVHDAAYMRVPVGTQKVWADRLVKAMFKGWKEICKVEMLYYKDIPMGVEYEYIDPDGTYVCEEIFDGNS